MLPDQSERSPCSWLKLEIHREATVVKAGVVEACREAQNPEKMWKTLPSSAPMDSDCPNLPCQIALE